MIVIKTEKFHKKIIYDMADLAMFRNEYLESIIKWDREGKLMSIGYGHQPSKTVKFFGSYFDKKIGSHVTDIDVILLINSVSDSRFQQRLVDILKRLDKTNFKFVRFYCGYIQGLEPPWTIGDNADCKFDIDKVDAWLKNVEVKYPNVYAKVKRFLDKDTISMDDLINSDQAIEPNISLTWTKEEIIQGYKIYNGVHYSFNEAMRTYNRYRVMKFLYKYEGRYCLVDLNFVSRDKSIPRSMKDPVTYYKNNVYKKYKYLKKMLRQDKLQGYFDDRKEAIGHITPLAAFAELIQRLKKYNIVSLEELKNMEDYAKDYADNHGISTIDHDEIQEIITEKITPLYEKYKKFIKEQFKQDIYIFNIRNVQLNDQVPKRVLRKRHKLGYDCPLFPINVKHIEYIYQKARDIILDPYKLYTCLSISNTNLPFPWVIENVFANKKYKIVEKDGKYTLFMGNDVVKKSSRLQKLQRIALTGNEN